MRSESNICGRAIAINAVPVVLVERMVSRDIGRREKERPMLNVRH